MPWDSSTPRLTTETASRAQHSSSGPGMCGRSAWSRGLVEGGDPEIKVGVQPVASARPDA
eukprot:11050427-Alexandrium_andersonii.AAC.1